MNRFVTTAPKKPTPASTLEMARGRAKVSSSMTAKSGQDGPAMATKASIRTRSSARPLRFWKSR
ncbi:MAG: hypothetical protein AAF752_02865, partial [Bacteroidota bacterium]